jgi:A/G-specific adenine glycosylase
MLATARFIVGELKGKFPTSYDDIIQLKGIGPYTAAAIASFAYGLPHAVVDGNVYRVLARYFGIDTPSDSTEGKKQFQALAQDLLDTRDSSAYNQAIMDLGATVCTPGNPNCGECPLQKKCVAYNNGLIALLPVKTKKLVVRKRYFHYLLLQTQDSLWIEKRTAKDIWQNLHQPYLIEADAPLDTKEIIKTEAYKQLAIPEKPTYEGSFTQKLTHQTIETRFFKIALTKAVKLPSADGKWVKLGLLKNLGFPKTAISFFEKNLYF